jgi:Ca2+/H+ antiporter
LNALAPCDWVACLNALAGARFLRLLVSKCQLLIAAALALAPAGQAAESLAASFHLPAGGFLNAFGLRDGSGSTFRPCFRWH